MEIIPAIFGSHSEAVATLVVTVLVSFIVYLKIRRDFRADREEVVIGKGYAQLVKLHNLEIARLSTHVAECEARSKKQHDLIAVLRNQNLNQELRIRVCEEALAEFRKARDEKA